MRGPRQPDQYPDRFLDCQEALEDGFLALLDQAEGVGWSRAETIAAITELADNTALADADIARIDAAIKRQDW